MRRLVLAILALAPALAPAGLYYSGEQWADLPAQWRGFLLDHRQLRMIAAPNTASPLRADYVEALAALDAKPSRSADEEADAGALLVRLGRPADAVARLRPAVERWPDHHRLIANLGTAWQMVGEPARAASCLAQAIRLAPTQHKKADELQLRLVRRRQAEATPSGLDDLFGVPLPSAEARQKLPPDAVSQLQRLCLTFPADARLLWQLAELASAFGDDRTAAAMLDGCVTELGLSDPLARERRRVLRQRVDAEPTTPQIAHADHATANGVQFRSARPLPPKSLAAKLPAIKPNGINPVPWALFADTRIDRNGRPKFAGHLTKVDGLRVRVNGFMHPTGDDLEMVAFLLVEYPVGCWFCETPEPTGLLLVELPAGKVTTLQRGLVGIEGVLKLNRTDPEQFLYSVTEARLAPAD